MVGWGGTVDASSKHSNVIPPVWLAPPLSGLVGNDMQYAIYYYGCTCVYGEPPQRDDNRSWHLACAFRSNHQFVARTSMIRTKSTAREDAFVFIFIFGCPPTPLLPSHLPLRVSTPRASIERNDGFGDIYLLSLPYHRSVMSDLC